MAAGAGGGGNLRQLVMTLLFRLQGQGQLDSARGKIDGLSGAAMRAGSTANYMGGSFVTAALGMGAGMAAALRITAQFRTQVTLAAFAANGATTGINNMAASAKNLSQAVGQSPVAMASLTRQIAQLGVVGDQARYSLAGVAASLSVLSGREITGDAAATAIYRLLQATSRSKEEFKAALTHADRYGSAILSVANKSAGGIPAMVSYLRNMSTLGTVTNFTAGELIVLSGALTNVNERAAASFSTSLTRLFSKEFDTEGMAQVAALMQLTTDQAIRMKDESPFAFYIDFLKAVKANTGDGKTIAVLDQLGLDNTRDIAQITAMIQSLEKVLEKGGFMDAVNEQLNKGGSTMLMQMMDRYLITLPGAWDEFTSSVERAAIAVGESLTPALVPLLKTLTSLVDVVASNKWLAGLLVGTAGVYTGTLAGRAFGGGAKAVLGGLGTVLSMGLGGLGGGVGGAFRANAWVGNMGFRTALHGGSGRHMPVGLPSHIGSFDDVLNARGPIDKRHGGPLLDAVMAASLLTTNPSKREAARAALYYKAVGSDDWKQYTSLSEKMRTLGSAKKLTAEKQILINQLKADRGLHMESIVNDLTQSAPALNRTKLDTALDVGFILSNFVGRPFRSAKRGAMRLFGRKAANGIDDVIDSMHGNFDVRAAASSVARQERMAAHTAATRRAGLRNIRMFAGKRGAVAISSRLGTGGGADALVNFLGMGAGRMATGRMATGVAARAVPIAGQIGLIAAVLAPLAGGLARFTDQLRSMGGALAGLGRVLTLVLKTVELVANSINWVFEKTFGLIFKWLDKLSNFPGMKQLGGGMDSWIEGLDKMNAKIAGKPSKSASASTNLTINTYSGTDAAARQDTAAILYGVGQGARAAPTSNVRGTGT